jgi:hypothetical protein
VDNTHCLKGLNRGTQCVDALLVGAKTGFEVELSGLYQQAIYQGFRFIPINQLKQALENVGLPEDIEGLRELVKNQQKRIASLQYDLEVERGERPVRAVVYSLRGDYGPGEQLKIVFTLFLDTLRSARFDIAQEIAKSVEVELKNLLKERKII